MPCFALCAALKEATIPGGGGGGGVEDCARGGRRLTLVLLDGGGGCGCGGGGRELERQRSSAAGDAVVVVLAGETAGISSLLRSPLGAALGISAPQVMISPFCHHRSTPEGVALLMCP